MSFSGLKTAVVNLAHNAAQTGRELDKASLALAAGGVAANSIIRADLQRACREHGYRLYVPPLSLCGDNGAMIGAQGYYEFRAGRRAETDLNAFATLDIAAG